MERQCVVGDRIFRNYSFLRTLALIKSERKRLKLLTNASTEQILALIDAAANVSVFKTFCLSSTQKNKLKPYDKHIKKLSNAKDPNEAMKLLQKAGGRFLPSLLMPVLLEVARTLLGN